MIYILLTIYIVSTIVTWCHVRNVYLTLTINLTPDITDIVVTFTPVLNTMYVLMCVFDSIIHYISCKSIDKRVINAIFFINR